MLRKLFSYLLVSQALFSCDETKINNNIKNIDYYLSKVDSIKIVNDNKIRILDYDRLNRNFLAADQITKELLLIKDDGDILERVNMYGEGPNQYNSNVVAAAFLNESNQYILLSSNELILYDSSWNLIMKERFASESQIVSYTGPRFKVPYYFITGDNELVVFPSFFSGFNAFLNNNYVNNDFLIEKYSLASHDLNWVFLLNGDDSPVFKLYNESSSKRPVQVYFLDSDKRKLYLTFEVSNELGIFDVEDNFKLHKKVVFNHETFDYPNGSKNEAVINLGGNIFGILYFKGLPESLVVTRKEGDPEYNHFYDPSLYSIVVLNEFGSIRELPFPTNCEPKSEIVQISDSRFMLRDKYFGDDEPEFSSYSIFELSGK